MHGIASLLRFKININRALIYVSVFFAFWNTAFFSIDISIMHLTLYRIMLLVFMILIAKENLRNNSYHINRQYHTDYTIIFFKLWLVYAFLSLLWVYDLMLAVRSIFFLLEATLAICVLTIYVKDINMFYKLFLIFMFCMFIHSLIGWNEIATGNYKYLSEENYALTYAYQKLPVSSFHNVNDFATMMYLGFFSTLGIFNLTKQRCMKFFCIICMLNFSLIIIISRSRGAIFALVLAIFIYLLFQRKIMVIFKVMIFTFLAALILLFILNSYFEFNITELINTVFVSDRKQQGGSDYIRINLIKNGFVFLGKTLGLGTGAGNIEYYMENFRKFDTAAIINMHNFWMEILAGYGVFIFSGCIVMLLRVFRHFYKSYKKKESNISRISQVYIAFLISFVIAAISSSSLLDSDLIWLFFAIMIAFDCNIANRQRNKIALVNKDATRT